MSRATTCLQLQPPRKGPTAARSTAIRMGSAKRWKKRWKRSRERSKIVIVCMRRILLPDRNGDGMEVYRRPPFEAKDENTGRGDVEDPQLATRRLAISPH